MSPPASSLHVAKTTYRPSGDQDGECCTVLTTVVTRFGAPPSRSRRYSLSSAVKARRRMSGDGTASRTCRTANESAIGYWNRDRGPMYSSTSALNGIIVVLPDAISIFQILPPYVVRI